MRLVLPLTAAAAVLAAVAAPALAAAPPAAGSVPPDQDPFYAAPANLASYHEGQIVASRQITPKATGLGSATTWQISYRTDDSHGQPELTVTTLLVPAAGWTGTGARPVVSVQAPEDSTGTQCSPSYGVASGSTVTTATVVASVAPVLAKGWAVALPDFEGPRSVFMGGVQAAHAVLDGIRAVRSFGAGGITAANPWALDGYSGGAEATGWAAELQPTYAPELALAGAAIGGTPADPAAVAKSLDGGIFSGFEAAATASYEAEYPEAGIDGLLNAAGKTALPQARNQCLSTLLTNFAFKKLTDYTDVPDPLDVPSVAAVLSANTLGQRPPATPIYDYHANTDEIVPVAQDNTLVTNWCTEGAQVQKVRDVIGEHAAEFVLRGGDALNFLSDRFAAKPLPSTC